MKNLIIAVLLLIVGIWAVPLNSALSGIAILLGVVIACVELGSINEGKNK